ncbi:MAG: PASTA domain-containing protein, partial [Candidatus Hydrogenedens sp.]|nr:PASTA domain-containing protein [Candidatus Hydrogenedens sp.]
MTKVGEIEDGDTEYAPMCEYYPICPGNYWAHTPGGYGIGREFQLYEGVTGWALGPGGYLVYRQGYLSVYVGWEATHPPMEIRVCPELVPLGEPIQETLVAGLVVYRDSLGGLLERFKTTSPPLTPESFNAVSPEQEDCLGFVEPESNRLVYALVRNLGPVLAYLTPPLVPLMTSVDWAPDTYVFLESAQIAGNRSCPGGAEGEGEGEPIVNVIVPDVVGQLRDAARTAIAGARLTVGAVTEVFHATVPEGVVISQFPPAGVEVAEGTAVSVVVSLGVHMVTVPDVVGQAQGPAADAIRGAELAVGGVTGQAHATIPAGVVISQEPGAGARVAPGTAVALVVSLGLQPVNVPDVVGLELAVASATLSSGSLSTGLVSELHHASAPAGRVISQNPAAGARVMPGTGVALVVSKGPQPVVVPNVVGRGRATAAGVIGDAALTVGEVSERYHETVAVGLVISQNPAAGTMVPPGTAVSFAASIGPPPVTVPDVAGQSESAASGMIVGAGLTVGSVTGQSHATVPAGRVISQYPAAGASAVSGSLVALVVSTGPQLVTVPNVAGRPQAEAQNTVTGAGLSMGTVTGQCSDTAAYGVVIGQTPAA